MKFKTLTILTLFISFNYSVYSEDKKNSIKKYKLYDELNTMVINFTVIEDEIEEITVGLSKLVVSTKSQNYINWIYMDKIVRQINDANNRAQNLMVCLSYEEVIYQSNISHKLLINTHNLSREFFISRLESQLKYAVGYLKEYRIKIQNTAAVIAVNKSLELMNKLQKWVLINRKPVLKPLP